MFRSVIAVLISLHVSFTITVISSGSSFSVNYFDNLRNDLILRTRCRVDVDTLQNSTLVPCARPIPSYITVVNFEYDFEIFLCMGVYDSILRVCDLNTNVTINTLLASQNRVDLNNFCELFSRSYESVTSDYTQTGNWVDHLKENLNNIDKCSRACFGSNKEVNPLCSYIFQATLFFNSHRKGNASDPKEANGGNVGKDKKSLNVTLDNKGAAQDIESKPLAVIGDKPKAGAANGASDTKGALDNKPAADIKTPLTSEQSNVDKPKAVAGDGGAVQSAAPTVTKGNSSSQSAAVTKETPENSKDETAASTKQLNTGAVPTVSETLAAKEPVVNKQKGGEQTPSEDTSGNTLTAESKKTTAEAADTLPDTDMEPPPVDSDKQTETNSTVPVVGDHETDLDDGEGQSMPEDTGTGKGEHSSDVKSDPPIKPSDEDSNKGVMQNLPEDTGTGKGKNNNDVKSVPPVQSSNGVKSVPPVQQSNGVKSVPPVQQSNGVKSVPPVQPSNEDISGAHGANFVNAENPHYFYYFLTMVVLCIIGYLAFHNKQKILALTLEGRSRRYPRRRTQSNTKYKKLDSNLEEAVTSSCKKQSTTSIIY